ncbi:energy transducer TonB [Chitinophaga solisilvae]|uniref:energy transducer TonB n=1 Tax=Chitinophaga solisilvae TaxID=1233460 RepID=UPI00136852DD|nr:energy transducer TonB [Chitinophaga solisilvae]
MDSTKISNSNFLDILFDGRNKDYGAYELRNRYDRRVRNAVMGTASIVLVMIGGYVVSNQLHAADRNDHPVLITKAVELENLQPPAEEPVLPPPPPVESAPPPVTASIDFVKPKIERDADVSEEEMPPRIEETVNKAIGFENREGEPGDADEALVDLKGSGNGTVVEPPVTSPDDKGPLTFVEMMPEFPGGEAGLIKYLKNRLRYPSMAQENGIEGAVYVQFVVNRDGSISDVKTTGGAKGGGLEDEARRVVSVMPKWKPGKQNGQAVAVLYSLPIRFALEH